MSIFWLVLLGLAMGAVFGVALEKSRVMEPGVLVGQFQFRNFTMLKMFLAATITGLIALAVLNGLFGVALHPKSFTLGPVLIGGLILGVGIALAGACPGTALAQAGAGYRDAYAVIVGGIAGAIFYGYNIDWIGAALSFGSYGKITFADLLPLPFWGLALILAAMLAAFLVVLERLVPWQADMDKAEALLEHDAVPAGRGYSAPAE